MRFPVTAIMQKVSSTVNQAAEIPTLGGSEYTLWLEFINRGLEEWAGSHDWEELKTICQPVVLSTSVATVPLPLNFAKLSGDSVLYVDGLTEGEHFPNIRYEQRGLYNSTDKYTYILGNSSDGYNLIFHPATLASGASLLVEYYATPTSLASPADVPNIPDPQYLVDRTIAFIFESRSDGRFQQQEVKAREKLLQMIDRSIDAKYSDYNNPSPVLDSLQKRGFRVGRD